MKADAESEVNEEFTCRLAACDEALAAGAEPAAAEAGDSAELRCRLERGLACVQLLQQLRPQRPPDSQAALDTARRPATDAAPADGAPCYPAQIGRFQIRRPLGRGSFGVVYLAYDPVLGREVALKIPRADVLADAECRARFQREARAAAGLDHPNLVHVHEAWELGPMCYIALAYCPGNNLADWLKQRTTPVAWVPAAGLVAILAQAIHYAHTRGVLHRDLKPSNVMLSPAAPTADAGASELSGLWVPEPETGFLPRVTDFGLAKFDAGDGCHTRSGAMLGTPAYMSLEQLEGRWRDVGPATDVYALGVILFEMLTGRPPFWGETAMDILWQVKTAEPVSPSQLRPQLPRDLATICLKCLNKEPRKRYETAQALADDLGRFLAGQPIQARPTGRTERILKWARRRPGLAGALAALVVVTILGLGGILLQWYQTQLQWYQTQGALIKEARARRDAEQQKHEAQKAHQAEARERAKSDVTLYHNRVMLAYSEWSAGNVERALQLLEECPVELRHWEWRYVRRLCDGASHTLLGHTAEVYGVVFSPDGQRLASAAGSWDGKRRAEAKLWDATTGKLLWSRPGPPGTVLNVAFSPDGRQLHLLSQGGPTAKSPLQIQTWNTATARTSGPRVWFPQWTRSAAFSPDGRRLATTGRDGAVRLWDAATGAQQFVLKGHRKQAIGVVFSPDGRWLVSAGEDRTARVWDTASGKQLHELLHPDRVQPAAFSPDGRLLATPCYDRGVRIWDAASGQLLCHYWGHTTPVLWAEFAPDGRWLASGDRAGTVHIWDVYTGHLCRTIRGHKGGVTRVAFSPEGRRLATSSRDQTVRIWDLTVDQEAVPLPQTLSARQLVFSPDGKYLAASDPQRSNVATPKCLRIWPVGDPLGMRNLPGHSDQIECVAFHPDGKLVASGSKDKTVRLWDVATGQTVRVLRGGHDAPIMGVSFSPDGKQLASAGLDKIVRLWDVASGRLLGPVLTHSHPLHDVAFAPKGRRLVTAGRGGRALVWDVETATIVAALSGHEAWVEQARFSPDGRWLATACWDRKVRLWEITGESAGRPVPVLRHVLRGHMDRVYGLSFSHDSRRLASVSRDHTLVIWDVASGNEALTLRGHTERVTEYITGVAFSPDGRLLVAASNDIKIWRAEDYAPQVKAERAKAAARLAVLWHERAVRDCMLARPAQWFGAAFHLSRLLEARPADRGLYVRRGNAEVALALWQQAADDYARTIELGTADSWPWLQQTWLRLQTGDRDGYRSYCVTLLERFGHTEQHRLANELARVCTLGPGAMPDFEQPFRLAQKAVAAAPDNPAYRHTLGALHYRAGRFEAALASLQDAVRLANGQRISEDWLFLAMTHRALGHDAEARNCLDKAMKGGMTTRTETLQRPEGASADATLRPQLQILLHEVVTLLAR